MFHILNPLYLSALAFAAVPLVFHLLGRRRIREKPFSSLFLLKEVRKASSMWMRIKNLILLILRMLFIIFVVAAFSHPLILSPVSFLGSEAPGSTGILVDVSLSMGVEGILDKARNEIIRISNSFGGRSNMHLVSFSDRIEKEEEVRSISNINSFLNDIKVTYRGTNMRKALEFSQKKLSDKNAFVKRVFIVSDFQKYALEDLQNVFEKMHKQGIEIYASRIERSVENLYFSGFRMVPSFPLSNLQLKMYPKIIRDKKQDYTVEFFLSGLIKGLKKSTVNTFFEINSGNWGYKSGYFHIDGDKLSLDNDFYFSFYVPQSLKVLLIAEENRASYVSSALAPGIKSPIEVETLSRKSLLGVKTDKYDFVIFYDTGMDKFIETQMLHFLSEGVGILIVMGERFRDDANQKILSDIQVLDEKDAKQGFFSVKTVDTGFEPLSGLKHKGLENLYDTKIFRYFKLDSEFRNVIVAKNGDPLMVVGNVNRGKVVIIPFAIEPQWTQLPYKAIFVPLMYRLAFYLSKKREKIPEFRVGESISIASSKKEKEPFFLLPDGRKKSASVVAKGNELFYVLKNTNLPGIYRFIPGPGDTIPVAVNVKEEESNLDAFSFEELKAIFPNIKSSVEFKRFAEKGKRWVDLFPLFLILSILCITAELVLENR